MPVIRRRFLVAPLSLAAPFLFAASPDFQRQAMPFMKKHCHECHGGRQTKGDLDLTLFKDDSKMLQNRKVWREILKQAGSGEMPPKKITTRPSADEVAAFEDAISSMLAKAESTARPDPGSVTTRRLNRVEYNNTVRDLVFADINPAEDFPADDIGNGFDNMGDVLSLSPMHLERFLAAAENIAARVIVLKPPAPPVRTLSSIYLSPGYKLKDAARAFDTAFELSMKQKLTIEGDYTFRTRVFATSAGDAEGVKMSLNADDKELQTFEVPDSPLKKGSDFETRLKLSEGDHKFSVKFFNPPAAGESGRMLYTQWFQVIGPADTRPEFQQRLAAMGDGKPKAERTKQIVTWFVSRAFRRPPTKEEVARYTGVFETGEAGGGIWEAGAQAMVKAVLSSPKFIYRPEADDQPRAAELHPVNEFALATRLSYFLWSTMPDEELFALAEKQQLSKTLETQVKRMLADKRAGTLVQNFALQWLQLKRLSTSAPDATMFPEFNEPLRRAMLRETELFFAEIIREDRSVLDLLDADFTYLNNLLAKFYGIMDTVGNRVGVKPKERRPGGAPFRNEEFVRVSLPPGERGGLLTQASVLTVTSNPTRTSPVKRGKWVLEQILGTPPPEPPPGVAQLDQQTQLTGTLRQRMEQHRANPNCASCHEQMDALGFAFENYDAIGRFRLKDGDAGIDPSGTLPDGKCFKGPAELKVILKDRSDLIARNITEKMLAFSLGRGLEYYDERSIKRIVTDLSKADYKFSALVSAIVNSDPFKLRRGTQLDAGDAKRD